MTKKKLKTLKQTRQKTLHSYLKNTYFPFPFLLHKIHDRDEVVWSLIPFENFDFTLRQVDRYDKIIMSLPLKDTYRNIY